MKYILSLILLWAVSGLYAQKVEFEKGDRTLKGDLQSGRGKKTILSSNNKNILLSDFVVEYPTQQYAGADAKGGSQGLIGSSVGIMGTISNPDTEFLINLSGKIYEDWKAQMEKMGFNVITISPEEARSQKLFSKKEGKGSRIVNGESWEIEGKKPPFHSILTRPRGVELAIFDHPILAEGHVTNLGFALKGTDAVKVLVKIKVGFMSFETRSNRLGSSVQARTSIDVGNIETKVRFIAHTKKGGPVYYQVHAEAPIFIDDNSYILDTKTEKKNILGNKRTWNTYEINHKKYGELAKATSLAFLKEAFTVYSDFINEN